ncbi:MAG: disulfide bond formation protein B [Roseobacter sp.]
MTGRQTALVAAFGSLALMLAAYGFQHIGGMAPCKMCIWQRYPHVVAIMVGGVIYFAHNKFLAACGALAAAVTSAIGFFHAGVEQGWWEGPSTCTSGSISDMSVDDVFAQIMQAPLVRCDDIPWELFGISMAGWNGVVSLGLCVLWVLAYRRS